MHSAVRSRCKLPGWRVLCLAQASLLQPQVCLPPRVAKGCLRQAERPTAWQQLERFLLAMNSQVLLGLCFSLRAEVHRGFLSQEPQ